MSPARWLAVAAVAGALIFAVECGEYSTWDYLVLRRRAADEADSLRALRHRIDSLRTAAEAIRTDPRVQERVARERLGMIGKGEYVYRIAPDSDP